MADLVGLRMHLSVINGWLMAIQTFARPAPVVALAAFASLLGGCVTQRASPPVDTTVSNVREEYLRGVEERKNEVIKQLAICESGGYGPSDKPIYGARGLYLGRLQFDTRTVISYVQKRDGVQLNPKEAAELAHDYNRASDLAKYMVFDLEEPWHWPVCAKKVGVSQQVATIKQL
jgi:hypothetical protein